MPYLDYLLTISRRSRLIRLGRIAPLFTAVFIFLLLTGAGGTGSFLHLAPDAESLLVFFKEPFVVFCLICMGWFIASLRPSLERWEECKFLSGLPLSGRALYAHFVFMEWSYFLWVPVSIGVVYAGLAGAAPWPYLFRLSSVTLVSHLWALIASHTGHLIFMIHKTNRTNFLYKAEPWISVTAIFLFTLVALAGLAYPPLISGINFWLVLSGLLLFILALWRVNNYLFALWQRHNVLFRMPSLARKIFSTDTSRLLTLIRLVNPWLWKSILRSFRQRNRGLVLLTAVFILLSYLSSMNNRLMADRASVLLAIAAIYSAVFAYRNMQRSSVTEESAHHIFSLPVRTISWFAAMMIPAMIWIAGLDVIFSALIAVYSPSLAMKFLVSALLLGFLMLLVAVSAGMAFFPDLKRAQKQYTFILLTGLILSALFYRYHPAILAILPAISLIRLLGVKYYKG